MTLAAAQEPLKVEDIVRPPAYVDPKLSESGRFFAVAIPINGRLNLAVVDLETRKGTALTNFSDFDVVNFAWVGDERIVFTLGRYNTPTGPAAFEGGGLFVVGRDGKEFRRLSETVRDSRRQNKFVYRRYEPLRTLPGNNEEILAVGNLRDADSEDVYRLNVRSGRATLMTPQRPSNTVRWVLDRNLVPRVVTSWVKDSTSYIVWYRKDADSPWEELTRYDMAVGPVFVPLAFEANNRTLQVAFNGGRDTMAVFRYDPETRKLGELLAQHPRYDMGANALGEIVPGITTDPKTDEVIGYAVAAERPQRVWLDESRARLQKMIDAALPDTVNSFVRTPQGKQIVVTARSDRLPTRWYLLDEEKRTLEELFASRPWIKPGQLVEMRPFLLKTRDGLEIPSYYFLPNGYRPGTRLPTVIHIHGGPTVRADFWGAFSFGVVEAQVLAARGYAVVLPNFRGTPGFGGRIYYAGFGTIGRQMLEDHQDAAKWAVEQGFADPDRICISGASYGGYATLMALARFPETFKCGIAGLIVSDMRLFVTSPAGDVPYSPAAVSFWNRLVG
ncbi:MAG: prolyl oligopeptidase family serine peptidase, partial [Acidimicrobiales bacterium]|nr:prolyl oligopeptidase family serine peptidase [Acidimicrobiales bacterium]